MNRLLAFLLAGTTVALTTVATTGCAGMKGKEEAQAVIAREVVGMPAGDFFERYGRWRTRSEVATGAEYRWESAVGTAPPGPEGLDERVCRLRILVDKAGRIESAVIVQDNPGRLSTSRCGEMFTAR